MPHQLRLVSLNVERSKHLDLIIPFLEQIKPDVVCLMEVMEHDISRFAEVVGKEYIFEPMCHQTDIKEEAAGIQGVAIFSRYPLKNTAAHYYHGTKGVLRVFDVKNIKETNNHMLLVADVVVGQDIFRIGTTHFPVTPNGQADDFQQSSVEKLLTIVESQGEIVFCGDLNAPRGREIFSLLAAQYKDNVPLRYQSSIDGAFHRAGQLPYMVDGIFSTPSYDVSNVEMVCGLSDHCALVATIAERENYS